MTWAGQATAGSGLLWYEQGKVYWTLDKIDELIAQATANVTTAPAKLELVTTPGTVTLDSTSRRVVVRKGTGSPTTIQLPSSPVLGQEIVVKDGKGDAVTNNISVIALGGISIDGLPEISINRNYQSFTFVYDGVGWSIL